VRHAIEKIRFSGKRKIGMLGLSFKTGTDDLRESPLVILTEQLIGKGFQVSIYDPEVSLAGLIGANRNYVAQTLPHINSLLCESCDRVIEEAELVVVGRGDGAIREALKTHLRRDQVVLDLVHCPELRALAGRYHGLCW
jgi:GDP-mannose 6-dehydrogenase